MTTLPFVNPRPAPPPPPAVEMYCEGSMQPPVIKNGKPACRVCGKIFMWKQMVDQIKHIPEH